MTTTQDSSTNMAFAKSTASSNNTGTTTSHTGHLDTTPYPYVCGLDLQRGELPMVLLITLVVNSVSVVVLWRMRGMSDSVDHLLISILNLNDLLTTVIFIITWIAGWSTCGQVLLVDGVCAFTGWLGTTMVVWSAFIILIMTSLRFLSLVKPFYYRRNVDSRKVIASSLGTFVFCLTLFMFPFTGLPRPYVVYTENLICAVDYAPGGHSVWHRAFIGGLGVLGVATVLFVTVCNILIVKTLSTQNTVHANNIAAITTNIPTADNSSTVPRPGVTSHGVTRSSKRRIFQRVTLVVSFVYVLCYAPFVIRLVVDTAYNLDHQNDLVHSVTLILLFMSPLLNPFVYGLFNKYFRSTLFDMIRCKRKNNPVASTSTTANSNNTVETIVTRGASSSMHS